VEGEGGGRVAVGQMPVKVTVSNLLVPPVPVAVQVTFRYTVLPERAALGMVEMDNNDDHAVLLTEKLLPQTV
jgi:hypothetical protein